MFKWFITLRAKVEQMKYSIDAKATEMRAQRDEARKRQLSKLKIKGQIQNEKLKIAQARADIQKTKNKIRKTKPRISSPFSQIGAAKGDMFKSDLFPDITNHKQREYKDEVFPEFQMAKSKKNDFIDGLL